MNVAFACGILAVAGIIVWMFFASLSSMAEGENQKDVKKVTAHISGCGLLFAISCILVGLVSLAVWILLGGIG